MLTLVAVQLAGCNIAGPIAAVATGPPKMDAQYVMPDVPTVVFIDDPRNLVNPVTLRKVIAEAASQELMINQVVTTTITPQDAIAITQRSDRAGNKMSVEDIGRAVGAQQVVYVLITNFSRTPDGYTPRPVAAAQVKVIDVVQGQRVFPTAGEGFPVEAVGAAVDPSQFGSRLSNATLFEALARQLGDEVAKVFYRHEYKELGENLR
jgi:hypothetical protein